MTNRPSEQEIVGPFGRASAVAGVAVAVIGAASLGGCSEPPPPPPPPPPPVAQGPTWTLDDIDMDERVQFDERFVPDSEDVAQAVADFATAIIEGDHRALGEMLSPGDAEVLSLLVEDGSWADETGDLETVRVVRLDEDDTGFVLGLAYQDNAAAWLTGWDAQADDGGEFTFTTRAIKERFASTAPELDGAELEAPEYQDALLVQELIAQIERDEVLGRSGQNSGGGARPSGGGPGGEGPMRRRPSR